ncbi:MAG TPA: hypothetical protein VK735_46200 [Pseudonocardia sp.]|uniref:hypothetical protein n=1 Tax=Pseudonocardia sp. TaxID=60912 RepID=UPI002C1C6042|nr:hypothetical protein [Pseudonocardia sp.]HTF54882.1 hypothetical protein [Pseudonocardia sp.]
MAEATDQVAQHTLDVSGLVVAPGFIDLHSHLRRPAELLLQAMDGVTTALDLEAGAAPVATEYQRAARAGLPVNYGFSACWALHRMRAAGLDISAGIQAFFTHIGEPAWQTQATPGGRARLLDGLAEEIADGALGIGILLGYAPGSSRLEFQDLHELAARLSVPTFTHARGIADPDAAYDGAAEVVSAALASGAHAHLCHLNSTSQRSVDRVHRLISKASAAGVRISTEAYPYGSGSTAIGSVILDPDNLAGMGLRPCSSTTRPSPPTRYPWSGRPTGRSTRPPRRTPGRRAPIAGRSAGSPVGSARCPCSTWSRGQRCARRGSWRRWPRRWHARGRVQAGADADLAVFDPDVVRDRSDYAAPARTSVGMRHVLVGGTFVVRDGIADPEARPGRPVRGVARESAA